MKNNALSLDALVCLAKDQVSCDLSGEAVVLDLKAGMYYGLNTVGAFVWNLISDKPIFVRDIQKAVLKEYDVDTESCEKDILQVLNQLADARLIEIKI